MPIRYPGQYYDGLAWINYNYYRDYDASVGRYIQSDPIGLAGGASTYSYSNGNPLGSIDPLGLRPIGPHERAFLTYLFGQCFATQSSLDIDIAPDGAWSPYGGATRFPGRYFKGGNVNNEIDLTKESNRQLFAHEFTHVWQRFQGGNVTFWAGLAQASRWFGNDPYDTSGAKRSDPFDSVVSFADLGHMKRFEAQAEMFMEAYGNRNRSPVDQKTFQYFRQFVNMDCGCGQ
jgi:RHS repeat-associated protein